MNNTKTIVIINIGKIDEVEALINAYKDNNIIIDSLPITSSKEDLKKHIDYYKNNYLIEEIILLNEASVLLKSKERKLTLKK